MKKVLFFSIIISLLLVFSTKTANACLIPSLDVDQYLNHDHRILVYGTIDSKLSNQRVILKVKDNYSKNSVNQYLSIYSKEHGMCTIDLANYVGKEVLIMGELNEGDTEVEVYAGSIKLIEGGMVNHVTLDNGHHELVSLEELSGYVSSSYDNQSYGGINENSLIWVMVGHIGSYAIGFSIIIILVIAIIKIRRKNYKYPEALDDYWK
ncbi:hypothetical protein [Haloplasma contractile]|uniref:Uncharacterized protein n=1 Tax=Haloplasma contractile SSD-17B TaxID=1033810 RepID=F7Q1V8_9MOLU|nr:hypothetical protein [Haloplasma contractile]ERJ12231.1 hypothetical protein HLPCO_001758 [Haloplasma contractile SSD-17B]